jgi:hypothetical protein
VSIGATKWRLRLPPQYRGLQPVFDTLLKNLDAAIPDPPGTSAGGSTDSSLPRVDAASYTASAYSPSEATVGVRVGADGYLYVRTGGSYTSRYAWVPAGRAASEYECQFTVSSGTLTSGSVGSWLACSAARTVELVRSVVGSESVVFTLEIRDVSTPADLTSAQITITALVSEEEYFPEIPPGGEIP